MPAAMEVFLEALVVEVESIEIFETSTGSEQGLYGLDSLSMELE